MEPQKTHPRARRSGSMVWRLTGKEIARTVAAFLSMDFLLCCVFLGALLYQAEAVISSKFIGSPDVYAPLVAEVSSVGADTIAVSGESFRLPKVFGRWSDLPRDSTREFTLAGFSPNRRLLVFSVPIESLRYCVTVPGDGGSVLYAANVGAPVFWFCVFMAGMFAYQALTALFRIPKISRSIRLTLRPISELTFAAHSMNMGQSASSLAPAREKLQLSGAIDQLNSITESHMDMRISIADEREELKGLASAINAMLDRLDAAYRSQLRFVSDASHELRTPIAVIQGYANMLDRWGKEDPDTLLESIAAIKAEAGNMKELIEQLLFLARSDNRSIVLEKLPVNLSDLAEEILRETRMIDPSHTFVGSVAPDQIVEGDQQLLKQAIRIFVDNSIKYTPSGEEIRVIVEHSGRDARVAVIDGGIGIAPEELPLVFERFYRSDESRARKTGGTGLGLSIAKWIVDEHGGTLEITSRQNLGTRVTFLLPAIEVRKAPSE